VDDDDDFQIVGSRDKAFDTRVDYSHPRYDCGACPWAGQPLEAKMQGCPECWCNVCSLPWRFCEEWKDHCCADAKLSIFAADKRKMKRAREILKRDVLGFESMDQQTQARLLWQKARNLPKEKAGTLKGFLTMKPLKKPSE
jgi:hypothetical protein